MPRRLQRTTTRLAALGVALGAGMLLACPLELPRGVSCGDGWWDPAYEVCDRSDPNSAYPDECVDCNICGDGVAAGVEQCDGLDLREQSCAGDSGILRCSEACTLDYDGCPAVCSDGILSDGEECDPSLQCSNDNDCASGSACYELTGECITAGENFAPLLSCSAYETSAIGVNKPYTSGTISRCTNECFFGRNDCGFCGDGQLDGKYEDFVYPGVGPAEFPSEFCDGKEAISEELEAYCEPLCADEALNSDVVVLCDFQCSPDCSEFSPVLVPDPSPESIGCCLEKESPCPKFGTEGVPEFPCCSWLSNPDWLAEQKCVAADSDDVPITYVCP